jgi:CubicO group peptidase (beta-lactamase class C family)
MKIHKSRLAWFLAMIVLPAAASANADTRSPVCRATDPVVATDVEALGWSATGLEAVRKKARSFNNDVLLIVTDGQIVLQDGPIDKRIWIASMRKSVLSILIGQAVQKGTIDLSTSLNQLGIDDRTPLTETEKTATVRDLIMSRSGIYLPTAAETSYQKEYRPERGSHSPGEYWFYNNWDFNVAGAIYEKLTGDNIFDSVTTDLAEPLCMQDWRGRKDGSYLQSKESRFPAYHMRMSTRDTAKIGIMMLNKGMLGGRQIVSPEWVTESTHAWSDTSLDGPVGSYEGVLGGYGYMWWVTTENRRPGAEPPVIPVGSFMAAGAGGQRITVIPDLDTVIVWRSERRSKNYSLLGEPAEPGKTRPLEEMLATIMAARINKASPQAE